jgi:hypothetical protein
MIYDEANVNAHLRLALVKDCDSKLGFVDKKSQN